MRIAMIHFPFTLPLLCALLLQSKYLLILRNNVKDSRRHTISGLPLGCALPHAVYYSLELNRREGAAMGIQSQQRLGSVLHQC